jgi:hypothetical protein
MVEPLLRSRQDPALRDAVERLRRRAGGPAGRLFYATGKVLRELGYLETAASQLRIAGNRLKDDEEVAFYLAWTLLALGDEPGAMEAAAQLEAPRTAPAP